MTRRVVVMGVSGCGKSLIGERLAERLGLAYVEGDALHPAANIAKMRRGEPLQDCDRWGWLDAVGRALAAPEGGAVATCSALKRAYRDRLRAAAGPVRFVHLDGARALIAQRVAAREGHFMPSSLLDSQFAALEPPGPDEGAIRVAIDRDAEAIVAEACAQLEGETP